MVVSVLYISHVVPCVGLWSVVTVKPVKNGHSKKRQNKDLDDKINGSLMKVESTFVLQNAPSAILLTCIKR